MISTNNPGIPQVIHHQNHTLWPIGDQLSVAAVVSALCRPSPLQSSVRPLRNGHANHVTYLPFQNHTWWLTPLSK